MVDDPQAELDEVRRQLAARAWTGTVDGSEAARTLVSRLIAGAVIGAAAGLLLLVGLLALGDGELLVAVVLLAPAAGLGVLTARVVRPAVRIGSAGARERDALLAREAQLVALAGTDPAPTPAFGDGPGLAPRDRQPSAYAQMMHTRFPVGRPPAEVLRRLPADAPAWRVAFHRTLGWGAAAPMLVVAAALTAYVVAIVVS